MLSLISILSILFLVFIRKKLIFKRKLYTLHYKLTIEMLDYLKNNSDSLKNIDTFKNKLTNYENQYKEISNVNFNKIDREKLKTCKTLICKLNEILYELTIVNNLYNLKT